MELIEMSFVSVLWHDSFVATALTTEVIKLLWNTLLGFILPWVCPAQHDNDLALKKKPIIF